MAIQEYADLVLATKFRDALAAQIRRSATLVTLLTQKGTVQGYNAGGPNWVVRGSGVTVATHEAGASFPTSTQDERVKASLGWGSYHTAFGYEDQAAAQARAAGNPLADADLFASNLLHAGEAFAHKLNQDFYSGSGSDSIIGIDTGVDDALEYANIDPGSKTYWASYVADPGTLTALTTDQVRLDLASIKNASGMRPNVALCNPLVFAKVCKLFDSQREFKNLGAGYESFLGEASVPTVMIDGVLFVEDSDGYAAANNGSIYYLNTSVIDVEVLPYTVGPLENVVNITPEDMPLGLQLIKKAKTAHSTEYVLRGMLQLVIRRRNACGKRVNIDIE